MKILSFDLEEFTLYPRQNLGKTASLYTLLDRLFDLLDSTNTKATFFCLGEIAREYPEVVRKIFERGHDIGCHSDKHKWLTSFSPKELYDDTRLAVDSIEQVIGKKVRSYRAPAFSIGEKNKWAIEILAGCGIEIDCSIFPASRDFGGLASFPTDTPALIDYNGITMKELPMSITNILGKQTAYSGGGYFRLLPYNKIKRITESRNFVISYFHLRDFDTEQDKKLSLRYFKSYYGIKGAWEKLTRYINDFDFIDIEQADKIINWDKAPRITL